jgi:aspartyl-tRNA synthetase
VNGCKPLVMGTEFKLFSGALAAGGTVKAVAVPDKKAISNSRLKPKGDVFNQAVAAGKACHPQTLRS